MPLRMTSTTGWATFLGAGVLSSRLGMASAEGPEWNDAMKAAHRAWDESRYADAEQFVRTAVKEAENSYEAQDRSAEAALAIERSLAIWEKVLGPEDVRVAVTLSGLARIYAAEGKYAKAEPLLRRSLAILEKTRGPKALELITDMDSYASLLRKMSRDSEATEVEARVSAIRAEHPTADLPKRAD